MNITLIINNINVIIFFYIYNISLSILDITCLYGVLYYMTTHGASKEKKCRSILKALFFTGRNPFLFWLAVVHFYSQYFKEEFVFTPYLN